MSLKDLVEGNCGGTNSLVQVASHLTQDRGLQDEGLSNAYTSEEHAFATANPTELLGEFWEHTLGNMQQAFRMDNLLAEMRDIEAASFRPKPQQSVPISLLAQQVDAREWANQFLESGSSFENSARSERIWLDAPVLQETSRDWNGVLPNPSALGFSDEWRNQFLKSSESSLDKDHTREEISNLRAHSEDFSGELNKVKKSAQDSVSLLEQNPDMQQSKLLKFMSGLASNGLPDVSTSEGATALEWGAEYKSRTFEEIKNEWKTEYLTQNPLAASSSSAVASSSKTEPALWNELNSHWKEMAQTLGAGAESDLSHQWFSDFSRTQRSVDYSFAEENPMQDVTNAFALGQEKLREGDIPSALLYLEAAAKQDPGNAEVWLTLGRTLAENEQDPQAIIALNKCLSLDAKNLDALMSLSICFTNESCLYDALETLKVWIFNNEQYAPLCQNIHIANFSEATTMEVHKQVLDLYLTAARENPTHTIDPDVQNGLGVLFNLSDEYDKAVDCFKAALQVRPDDSRLWNRLGASLANGSRAEEAVEAYHTALRLAPSFVRARYNLGITCVHLGAKREAVEHFLTALNQQALVDGHNSPSAVKERSDSIWYSLRVVLSVLNRMDLHQYVTNRDLAALNKEFDIS